MYNKGEFWKFQVHFQQFTNFIHIIYFKIQFTLKFIPTY